jgi:hypothetical protein
MKTKGDEGRRTKDEGRMSSNQLSAFVLRHWSFANSVILRKIHQDQILIAVREGVDDIGI